MKSTVHKTNIAPAKQPSQKETTLPTPIFQVLGGVCGGQNVAKQTPCTVGTAPKYSYSYGWWSFITFFQATATNNLKFSLRGM